MAIVWATCATGFVVACRKANDAVEQTTLRGGSVRLADIRQCGCFVKNGLEHHASFQQLHP
jgi:hypothetical protein